ncbi:uncharacterized protein LOC113211321 [Frankliniella occidentalis]|uniref:Uncharacterized protein LOC113211321 n=1 Tax=Frankliniella occidentalis TaxID=133901 RepID=A0A6J1T1I9_FRAOC|nr:uncharacterized protein LOC113211321 [Frankliniella occidentalis]
MRVLLACSAALLLLAVAHVTMGLEDDGTKSVEQLWEEWKVENGRKYDTPEEEKKRFGIFKDNKKRIDEHNEKFKKGEVSFSQGLTLWADITSEEFKARHPPLKLPAEKTGLAGSL